MISHRLYLSLLVTCLFPLVGCNTIQVNSAHSSSTSIIINDQSLRKISRKAVVDMVIYSDDAVIETVRFNGLPQLPFHYSTSENDISNASVEVKVSAQGETILSGESQLIHDRQNLLTLNYKRNDTLVDTQWLALDLGGEGIPANVSTTVSFAKQGVFKGFTGCNHYRGNINMATQLIELGQIENTQNICPRRIMFHENRYFNLLKSADYYEVKDGKLHLYSPRLDKPMVFKAIGNKGVTL